MTSSYAFENNDFFHFCHLILEQITVDSCVFLNIRSSIIRGWSWLYFRVFTSKFVCISAHLGLSVLGLHHYDHHSRSGNVCPPHRWHIWHSSCCSLLLCWWRCSVGPACKSGLLSFTSSPMPLRKSGRWANPSTFGFCTPLLEVSWALVMKIDRSRVGEIDNPDPDLHSTGRVFRGKSLIPILSPCQILFTGCCSLKAVVFEDIWMCLSLSDSV